MEAYMELRKKTTILFSEEQHEQLARLAEQRGSSIGELVRDACAEAYGLSSPQERLEAVVELGSFSLPVDDVATMKRESVELEK
jgi:hypothetical protein